MGDPKFPHKTYSTPRHPWEKDRIDSERVIVEKYGLKNKRELWKGQSFLDNFRSQARDLQAKLRNNDPNAQKQYDALIARLNRYKLLGGNATLDDVLSLDIEAILARRLQTIVYRRNLARTLKQARQLITHGHVTMNGRRVTIPSIMVEATLEDSIEYVENSPFKDDLHPMRQVIMSNVLPNGEREQKEEAPPERSRGRNDRQGRRGRGR
ncbi:MAG: 30S ribosomal protein S4 [Thermoplasmataceae archaeon]|jgi:small subunit ribosomal protein S4